MRLCFIADLRSPTAINWIRPFVERGHEVFAISSYPFSGDVLPGARVFSVPLAFGRFAPRYGPDGKAVTTPPPRMTLKRQLIRSLRKVLDEARYVLGPLDVARQEKKYRELISSISPDLVHALRIPYEGIIASLATPHNTPLIISTWGSDPTLQARKNPLIGFRTRRALIRADALLSDTMRDIRLAIEWSFDPSKPSLTLAGGGGVRRELFHPGPARVGLAQEFGIGIRNRIVINPRGFRPGAVRQDVFFEAVAMIKSDFSDVTFICPGLEGIYEMEKTVRQHALSDVVRFLPKVSHVDMAELFRLAEITVSLSVSDGTPNSLLEGMACGCFPVVGDIESTREWLVDGENGLLVDATDASAVAAALRRALTDHELREKASSINLAMVAKRASHQNVMAAAEEFYHQVASTK